MLYTKKRVFCLSVIIFLNLTAKEGEEKDKKIEQLKVGNLSLSNSQQPGALIGFGQNIIDKNDFLAFVLEDSLIGKQKNFTEVVPSILYGIQDNLSIFCEWPIAAKFKEEDLKSSGPEDFITQIEYAFHLKDKKKSTTQATLVTTLYLPTGDDNTDPPTGFGSPTFFFGLTANYLGTQWYFYSSAGILIPTPHHHGSRFGNQYTYQAGIGKNIAYSSNKWILTAMLEFSGVFSQKRKINGVIDQDSGGNIMILGPSIFFSTERLILQAGIAPVVFEHFSVPQPKDKLFLVFNLGWKFN